MIFLIARMADILAKHDQRPMMKKCMEEIGASAGAVERGGEEERRPAQQWRIMSAATEQQRTVSRKRLSYINTNGTSSAIAL